MSLRSEHAEHNHEVAEFLNRQNIYTDWVITCSFYSAIHFLQHKIFPFGEKNRGESHEINDLETYCTYHGLRGDKHSVMGKLVASKASRLRASYNHLKSICWTARYNNYKQSQSEADLSLKRLAEIKKACTQ